MTTLCHCGKPAIAKLVCVNAHDRCYGGADGDCPCCEVRP